LVASDIQPTYSSPLEKSRYTRGQLKPINEGVHDVEKPHMCVCFSLNVNVIRQYILSDLLKSVSETSGSVCDTADVHTVAPTRLLSHQQLVDTIRTS